MFGLGLEVGHPRDIGAFAGGELDGKLLHDHLIGDIVEHDVDIGVLLFEAVQKVGNHLAFIAVGIPHDTNFGRILCKGARSQNGQGDTGKQNRLHLKSPP